MIVARERRVGRYLDARLCLIAVLDQAAAGVDVEQSSLCDVVSYRYHYAVEYAERLFDDGRMSSRKRIERSGE